MEEDLFKRFHNHRLGVSFFYKWLLNPTQENQLNFDNENDLQLNYGELKFRIIKLSSEANIGLQLFGLENGLKSALNENETVTEEIELKHQKIAGNETAYTTTIYPTSNGNFKIRRYLVSNDGQGYLLAFQDRTENFESEKSQKIIRTILETFKFLD